MHVSLILTHECNLACTYCYMGEKFRRDMDWETAKRSMDLAFRETPPGQRVDIGFFGGEPLIAFEMLERVALAATARARAEGRRLRLAVTTNGTLVTPERAQRLRELGVEVTLSLDGTREAHDATRPQRGGRSSWQDVMDGAQALQNAGHPLEVIAVVAPGNVRYLGASVAWLADMGARNIILNPCFEEPWTDDELALWEQGMTDAAAVYAAAMRKGRPIAMPTFDNKLLAAAKGGLADCDSCSAGERELAVAPSGNLYPCARMVAEDRDHRLVVGHLDTGVDPRAVMALLRGPADPACEPCAERWRCGAGCACANLAETGTTHLPGGTQCWYEQASARVADAMGHTLLAERCETFIGWTYGRVAAAARAMNPPPVEALSVAVQDVQGGNVLDGTAGIRRLRRLPVLRAEG